MKALVIASEDLLGTDFIVCFIVIFLTGGTAMITLLTATCIQILKLATESRTVCKAHVPDQLL